MNGHCIVQPHLRALCIKFTPARASSPQVNGEVERTQRTLRNEFWFWVDLKSNDLQDELGVWLMYYYYSHT